MWIGLQALKGISPFVNELDTTMKCVHSRSIPYRSVAYSCVVCCVLHHITEKVYKYDFYEGNMCAVMTLTWAC